MFFLSKGLYEQSKQQGYIGKILPDYLEAVEDYDTVVTSLFGDFDCVVKVTKAGYEVVAIGNGSDKVEVTKEAMNEVEQQITDNLQLLG